MNNVRWFEKKWFVNLKTGTRQRLSFLFIAAISTVIGFAAVLIILSANIPSAQTYAVIIGAASVLNIILALAIANINTFLVTDPTLKNDRLIERFAAGNTDVGDLIRERDYITVLYQDEVGICSSKLKYLMDFLVNLQKAILQISEGDLTVEIPLCSPEDKIGGGLSTLVNNFNDLVTSIATAIDQVTSGANLVADSSLSLSQGTTHQASSVEQLSATLEQISEQTHLNAQNAEQANELTKSAKANAADGNKQMQEMLKAMDEISLSSSNINKVIKVIDDIAFQTNILALNAAVEAARAGQYGKGFAVVAEEVRNLAGKSANAAKETTEMIENSIRKVDSGTKIANQTASALSEIVAQVDRAADLINAIAVASVGQTRSIEEINLGIAQVSNVIQTNAATAQESAAASEELTGQAAQLKQQVLSFKLKGSIGKKAPQTTSKLQANGTRALVKPHISLSDDFGKY